MSEACRVLAWCFAAHLRRGSISDLATILPPCHGIPVVQLYERGDTYRLEGDSGRCKQPMPGWR